MHKRILAIVFLLAATSYASAQTATQDCAVCYNNKSLECAQTCSSTQGNSPGKQAKCKRACVVRACKENCNYQVQDSSREIPELVQCDYCTRDAKSSCEKKCIDSIEPTRCEKRCVSQLCQKTCSLPSSTQDALELKDNQKANNPKLICSQCKSIQKDACDIECGSHTGSTTCKVICLEKKCQQECHID